MQVKIFCTNAFYISLSKCQQEKICDLLHRFCKLFFVNVSAIIYPIVSKTVLNFLALIREDTDEHIFVTSPLLLRFPFFFLLVGNLN